MHALGKQQLPEFCDTKTHSTDRLRSDLSSTSRILLTLPTAWCHHAGALKHASKPSLSSLKLYQHSFYRQRPIME